MRKLALIGSALAVAVIVAGVGAISGTKAQNYGYGPGMMGPGYGPGMMMYGYGYGPGMMGGGCGPRVTSGPLFGPGMMGPGWWNNEGDLKLTAKDAKSYFERCLVVQGNPRLQVGEVKEKDTDTIIVDIITKDNSLVQRFVVNRHNGFYQPSES